MQRIRCQGGPYAGTDLTIHTYGTAPQPVELVSVPAAGGRYRLNGGFYHWEEINS